METPMYIQKLDIAVNNIPTVIRAKVAPLDIKTCIREFTKVSYYNESSIEWVNGVIVMLHSGEIIFITDGRRLAPVVNYEAAYCVQLKNGELYELKQV